MQRQKKQPEAQNLPFEQRLSLLLDQEALERDNRRLSRLLKAAKLNQAEFKEMMQHVEHGASILSWAPSLAKYIPSTRHHHEWYNGQGYPDGLQGDDIPLFAAIISIADAFDAMTSDRVYRRALSVDEAMRPAYFQFQDM